MKKTAVILTLAALIFGCLSFTGCGKADTGEYEEMLKGMELVWYDEFEGADFDRSKWDYGYIPEEGYTGVPRKGGFWINDAVRVEGGNMIITTDYRKDGELGEGWYSGAVETVSKSDSEVLFSATYGYFEARCKVPRTYGAWSAFWMMPVGNFRDDVPGTGTDGAEIDVFESPFYYDLFQRNTVNHAVHYDGYGENLKSAGKTGIKVRNLYDEFHTYGVEWTENYYKFYVDGVLTWTVSDKEYENKKGETVKQNCISQAAEYLILSNEVVQPYVEGETAGWCGDPMKNDLNKKYEFVIDYVRVYAQK